MREDRVAAIRAVMDRAVASHEDEIERVYFASGISWSTPRPTITRRQELWRQVREYCANWRDALGGVANAARGRGPHDDCGEGY